MNGRGLTLLLIGLVLLLIHVAGFGVAGLVLAVIGGALLLTRQ